MQIKARIVNRKYSITLYIDTKTEKCEINGKDCYVDIEALAMNLYSCVCSWPENLNNKNVLDGENYIVRVVTDNETKEYNGSNVFPKNYKDFKNYILKAQKSCKD